MLLIITPWLLISEDESSNQSCGARSTSTQVTEFGYWLLVTLGVCANGRAN